MSSTKILWSCFIALLCVYNAIEAPLNYVFNIDVSHSSRLALNSLISLIFFVDIYLSMKWHRKLFKDDHVLLGGDKTKHRRSYMRTVWFPLEVLSALPYEYFTMYTGILWLPLLKLIRISLLFKTFYVFKNQHLPKYFRLTIIMSIVVIVLHLVACMWIWLYPDASFLPGHAYTRALYWAVTTLTTTGYGDITPTTDSGKIFTIFVMLTGFSAFGVLVGQVSNLIVSKNRKAEENRQKMENLTSFLSHYQIPKQLRNEVFTFYQHMLNKNLSENDSKIISELPHSLQHEIELYIKIKLIAKIPVFYNLPRECLKKIALKLQSTFASSGDLVMKKGDPGHEMYIIDHGEVEVLAGPENKRVALLTHGQCFGEIALLTETTRNADVRAVSYCDLFKFEKVDFDALTGEFPELQENFEKIMKRRTDDSTKK